MTIFICLIVLFGGIYVGIVTSWVLVKKKGVHIVPLCSRCTYSHNYLPLLELCNEIFNVFSTFSTHSLPVSSMTFWSVVDFRVRRCPVKDLLRESTDIVPRTLNFLEQVPPSPITRDNLRPHFTHQTTSTGLTLGHRT